MNPDEATSLDRLHDVISPPPIPWWPLAPGWIWLFSVLLFSALWWAIASFISWQKNRYRREAIHELNKVSKLNDPRLLLVTLAEVLKRAALSRWSRPEVASLTGSLWFEFLDRTGTGKEIFATKIGPILEDATYDPPSVDRVDSETLAMAVREGRNWLRHHR